MYFLNLELQTKKLVDTWIDGYHVAWNGLIDLYTEELNACDDPNFGLVVPDRSLEAFIKRYLHLRSFTPALKDIPRCIWQPWIKHFKGFIGKDGQIPEKVKPRKSFKLMGPGNIDVMADGIRFPGQELITSVYPNLYVHSDVIGYRVVRDAGKYTLHWVKKRKRR